jgi:hypothetical protein
MSSESSESSSESSPLIAMMSGQLDLSCIEFSDHYVPLLKNASKAGHLFIVGSSSGADTMCVKYLQKHCGVDARRITIVATVKYISKSRNEAHEHRKHSTQLKKQYGENINIIHFNSHRDSDEYMTAHSHYDIAWVRSREASIVLYGDKFRERESGTAKNIKRRSQNQSVSEP